MTGREFKSNRKQRGWTQHEVAFRLGISQTYVALLERGHRIFPPKLAQRAVNVLKMNPSALPLTIRNDMKLSKNTLPEQLGALGYPGFAYMRAKRKKNPVEVLLQALAQDDLESRVTEALPWLALTYGDMNETAKRWLVQEVKLRNLTNRLGFVLTLALEVAEKTGKADSLQYKTLKSVEQELRESRLAKEDTLAQSTLSEGEKEWLRKNRSATAEYWNVLTDWKPEYLPYAS